MIRKLKGLPAGRCDKDKMNKEQKWITK